MSQYAPSRLRSSPTLFDASTDDADESYELTCASQPASERMSVNRLFMPQDMQAALNAAASRRASEDDVDSDDSKDEDNIQHEKPLFGSEGRRRAALIGDDVEGSPAWANQGNVKHNDTLKRRLTIPTITILFLVLIAAFFAGHSKVVTKSTYTGRKKLISLEDVMYGVFGSDSTNIDWLAEAGDGVYSYRSSDGSIMLHDVAANTSRMLAKHADIRGPYGVQLDWNTFSVSHDLRYVLFSADRDGLWRWSSRSNFYIHDLEAATTTALVEATNPPRTAIAKWAPQGHAIAYVMQNDLYIASPDNLTTPIRITQTGNETVFNGITDWVYEEEVFSSDSAVWWSPDGRKLAFLSFDESEVHQYSFPVYNKDRFSPGADSYPHNTVMRYPKPGTPNPKVTLHAFDFDAYDLTKAVESSTYTLVTSSPLDVHDRLVVEIAWVGDRDLIVRETDRAASRERVAHFDFGKGAPGEGQITRDTNWEQRDGGWAEAAQTIHSIDAFSRHRSRQAGDIPSGYLDVVANKAGYSHIAYFSPADAAEPVFLTSGPWEVDGSIHAVDVKRKLIYFIGANPSTERHVYSVPIPSQSQLEDYRKGGQPPLPIALTDTSMPGYYDASFSPDGGFYLLKQRSGLPWQKLVNINKGTADLLHDNARLNATLGEYQVPFTTYSDIKVNNISVNVAEITPANLDTSGNMQYPVLLRPYGGPRSQTVSKAFKVDFGHYLASSLGYIVLEVDGRGTGYRGRSFRSAIRKNLGELEAADQIAVAEQWAKLPYVDASRIGIQGWSYGGYLTSKVVEANSSVISLGIAVAPVTDWRYYDSIYSERYMGTLEGNQEGYRRSAVTRMDGFKRTAFMLAHGSGDDNVHYLNSAALLDRLTYSGVRNYTFRMFTDSAHSMGVRNAYQQLHYTMSEFLVANLGRAERRKHHAEQRR